MSAKFEFGPLFISWVQTLYHKPQARISTNGQISSTFPLGRSNRHGCPLSPGLFVLAIEPLAEARQDPDIKGFQVGQTFHTINLLADDVILYLKTLVTLFPIYKLYLIRMAIFQAIR